MPRILLISHNEICHNARLLKAADFFQEKGWEVTVFNPVTGIASQEVYKNTIGKRDWKVIENDISKRSLLTKVRWLYSSLFHKMIRIFYDKLKWKIFDEYYLNKGLILMPKIKESYDWILIHLVDNLPFAIQLKKRIGAKLIYDNQEYFVGQYAAFAENEFHWVKYQQEKNIKDVDVLLATTDIMKTRLIDDYQLTIPSFRVRNVPTRAQTLGYTNDKKFDVENETVLKLVWHGFAIYFNNRRGVHILLQAVAKCKEKVQLTLQGNFSDDQKEILGRYEEELDLKGKININPPANPDDIVGSLVGYDVGLTGELPEEMNQQLTSSNKLFDYIHAGLAVISSDALGLAETIDEFKVGLKYEPGNIKELSEKIDSLAQNRTLLNQFKKNSLLATSQLYWENEYNLAYQVFKEL